MQGRSLELYFIDGRPDGLLAAEVFNWTGHVLRIPRTQIVAGLSRPEAAYTGVYILVGQQNDSAMIYIGEAETMRDRLRQHLAQKDWWDEAILITTAGDALHKAHVKYLEARLVAVARSVARAKVENGNTPARSSLNEAATSNMDAFLDTLLMVLPAIRLDQFDEKRRVKPAEPTHSRRQSEAHFTLTVPRHGAKATARMENGEIVVESDAKVRAAWIGKSQERNSYFKLHATLLSSGIIRLEDEIGVFTEDYAFASPSAAAAVASGRAANGRTAWVVTGTDMNYADWEIAQTEEAAP